MMMMNLQSGQKKPYKDCLKASLKSFEIDVETWETIAKSTKALSSSSKTG